MAAVVELFLPLGRRGRRASDRTGSRTIRWCPGKTIIIGCCSAWDSSRTDSSILAIAGKPGFTEFNGGNFLDRNLEVFQMATGIRTSTGDHPTREPAGHNTARAAAMLFATAVGIVGLMWILGTLLVDGVLPAFVGQADTQTSEWVVDHRTPNLNGVTHVGSMMADTFVALAVTAVVVVTLRLWLGRWRESLTVIVAIVGELLIFLAITATVHRDRPSVLHLDQAPPTSSFPSGHTGAALALYGCLAVILLRNAKPRWLAVCLAVLGFAIPILVAASRVYLGMHYLTDVLAGLLASGIWLTVVLLVLLPRRRSGAT
jgi:membrane-associated phospholipid phosphatase